VAREIVGFGTNRTGAVMTSTNVVQFDRQDTEFELIKLGIQDYCHIFSNGIVDVEGNVTIPSSYEKIPVQFGRVIGNFSVGGANLVSLYGSPTVVEGYFSCENTRFKSMMYAPQYVGSSVYCNNTHVTSLEHMPMLVGGNIYCSESDCSSLHNIHLTKKWWSIGHVLTLPENCTHLLSLAYISGVSKVRLGLSGADIVVVHDPFLWQERLLDLGLTEQAQL
jgi:hypothetical protein